MAGWQSYMQESQTDALEQLRELIRIPSISALPEHRDDVMRAAEWVAERLRAAGIEEVQILPTGGHPVVYGHWLHAEDKPTILLYGHFDVQPVDPVELWNAGPFSGERQDGRILGRGASDMKGSLVSLILSVEALLKGEGSLPVNIKFILEGQEEIGSPQLPDFVAAHRDLLACDLVVSADGAQITADQPSIEIGLRGLAAVQLDVRGPSTDLHSGSWGGAVHNPIHALVRLLDSMHGPSGEITVAGFYDDVVPLTDEDRRIIAAAPFDEASQTRELGVGAFFGESGYTATERRWARPTLEINGIYGGFQGAGTKTVLPSEAHAKITCRLVPNQEPDRIVEAIQRHVEGHALPGVTVTVTPEESGARPYLIPADQWGNVAASEVLAEVYGKRPVLTRSGGSVPVCSTFLTELGRYTVPFGFGAPDELVHAPNEFWRLSSFERARQAYPLLLQRLARGG